MDAARRTWGGVLAVAALAAALPGCAEPVDEAEVARARAALDEVVEQMDGSRGARNAGALLSHHTQFDPVAACLRDAGLPYHLPPFVPPYPPGRAVPEGPSAPWFRPLPAGSLGIGEARAWTRRVNAALDADPEDTAGLDASERARWVEIHNSCLPGSRAMDEAFFPDGYSDVWADLDRTLRSVDVPGYDDGSYRACLEGRGFVGYQELDDPDDLYVVVSVEYTRTSRDEAQAFEARAAAADVGCRADAQARALVAAAPDIREFAATHAEDLARVEAGWESMLDQARDLTGWTSDMED